MKHFVFDCDDTLYDLRWPFDAAMHKTFTPQELEGVSIPDFYAAYRRYGDDIFPLIQNGTFTIDEAGLHRILHAALDWHLDLSLQEAADFQMLYKEMQQKIALEPALAAWMKETRAPLYVLTNGPDAHQQQKIKALKLADYMPASHIFTSGAIGHAKPEKAAFDAVNPDDDPQNWYYIGDNYENDMEGAKAAGWNTIHFNRHHRNEGPASDYTVYSADQLAELLRKLEDHA